MERNETMNEEKNMRFDSAIRKSIDDYEPTVPHALWNKIAVELHPNATDSIPHYKSNTKAWKIGVAATLLLTVGLGTLFSYYNTSSSLTTLPTPIAHAIAPTVVQSKPIIETKTIVQQKAIVKQVGATAPTVRNEAPKLDDPTIGINKKQSIAIENIPLIKIDESLPVETAVASENISMQVGSIPVNALKILSSPKTINDEITIIQSINEPHKRHIKKGIAKTKVVILNKKYDKQPDINYQVPVRF